MLPKTPTAKFTNCRLSYGLWLSGTAKSMASGSGPRAGIETRKPVPGGRKVFGIARKLIQDDAVRRKSKVQIGEDAKRGAELRHCVAEGCLPLLGSRKFLLHATGGFALTLKPVLKILSRIPFHRC